MCTRARHGNKPSSANPPRSSYHWSLPGRSLCPGQRKGHFQASSLLQLLAPPRLIQGGSQRERVKVCGVGAGDRRGRLGSQLAASSLA